MHLARPPRHATKTMPSMRWHRTLAIGAPDLRPAFVFKWQSTKLPASAALRARNNEFLQKLRSALKVGLEWEERARGIGVGAGNLRREGKGLKGSEGSQRAFENKMTGLDLKFARDE